MTSVDLARLDPDIAMLLESSGQTAFPAAAAQTPDQIRRSLETLVRQLDGPQSRPEPVGGVDDTEVELVDRDVPVRVYQPLGRQPWGTVVYFHGGGFVAGSINTHDKTTRRLCNGTGARVVSVDYRLAPEHPHPAGLDDCYQVTLWASLRFAPEPVVIAGDSAGGTMAAGVALLARDHGTPHLAGQVLVYPALDPSASSSSMREFADGFVLTRDDMQTYWHHLLDRAGSAGARYADLSGVEDLHDLPPALVVTAGFDPLRDEGTDYAARLVRANVPVVHQPEPGLIHGFLDMASSVAAAAAARDRVTAATADLLRAAARPR